MIKDINLNELRPSRLPHRPHAHPFDFKVKCDSAPHSVGNDPDSIDGSKAVGWYEAFRDRQTGELYLVHCYDGGNGGKLAHTWGHLRWMEEVQRRIINRTQEESVHARTTDRIVLSSAEWAIMRLRMFDGWLDYMDCKIQEVVRTKTKGHIGRIQGIEVHVDPQAPNPLGEPIDLAHTPETTEEPEDWQDFPDQWEAKAEALGYNGNE